MSDGDAAHVHRMWARDTASAELGIELLEVGLGPDGLGHARARMRVTAGMVNGHGIAHGGLVFALADSAFALACNAAGAATVAAGADITFLAPAHLDDLLEARATERVLAGRSGLTDVTVRRGDGQVIAELRGRSRALRLPQ